VYYIVIKHDILEHEGNVESVLYISRVLLNIWGVLSQCNTLLRLLHMLYDIEIM